MHVADHVERPHLIAAVGWQRHALDTSGVSRFGRGEPVDMIKILAVQRLQTVSQRAHLVAHGIRLDGAILPRRVALQQQALVQVEDDGDGGQVVLAREGDQWRAVLRAHVRGIHDGQAASFEPQPGNVLERGEGLGCGGFLEGIVGDQRAALVGAEHLGGTEVARRERALARATRPNQHHQTRIGDAQDAGIPALLVALVTSLAHESAPSLSLPPHSIQRLE